MRPPLAAEAGSTDPPAGTFTWSENEPSVIAWQPSSSCGAFLSRPATAPSPKLNMKRERPFA